MSPTNGNGSDGEFPDRESRSAVHERHASMAEERRASTTEERYAAAMEERADGRDRGRHDGRTVPDLLRELSTEGADLARQEVALFKAEAREKLNVYQRNLASIGVGSALMLASLLAFLWAANLGLTTLYAQVMGLEIAVWLSPVTLGVVLLLIGWGMVAKGRRAIRKEGVTPHRTIQTLEADRRWAGRKARQAREGIRNG